MVVLHMKHSLTCMQCWNAAPDPPAAKTFLKSLDEAEQLAHKVPTSHLDAFSTPPVLLLPPARCRSFDRHSFGNALGTAYNCCVQGTAAMHATAVWLLSAMTVAM